MGTARDASALRFAAEGEARRCEYSEHLTVVHSLLRANANADGRTRAAGRKHAGVGTPSTPLWRTVALHSAKSESAGFRSFRGEVSSREFSGSRAV